MPLTIPRIDDRSYQQLVDEALARIPVHTPEWTNFNDSDPGVTLVQLWAFLTESLLYRSNQIPERNRRKFLSLLGVPLAPGTAAQGLVTLSDTRGPTAPEPLEALTLPRNLELRAGDVRFRTTLGLDLLPVEAVVLVKRELANPDPALAAYYQQLYASFGEPGAPPEPLLYEAVPLEPPSSAISQTGVDLASPDIVDGALWVALLARPADLDRTSSDTLAASRQRVRKALGGKTLSLGLVPVLSEAELTLAPGAQATPDPAALLRYELPAGTLSAERRPEYMAIEPRTSGDLLSGPVLVQLTLPGAERLISWEGLEPLEPGADDFPPTLEDTNLADRLITWLRVRLASNTLGAVGDGRVRLLWAGINAAPVEQRVPVVGERMPDGTGDPDQVATLANRPVIPGSVRLTVTVGSTSTVWQATDDLLSAGPEVPTRDPRLPPGARTPKPQPVNVFTLNPESGELRFGDGIRGARPPFGAVLRADYAYSAGQAGNVGIGAIARVGPGLANVAVSNPVPTWGGADPETVSEGEKQIARFLHHRDRLVTAEDFATITRRTPGVALGRVEVIPTFNPELLPNARGAAPGAVTLMVIPAHDMRQPDAPEPDRLFLKAICDYLEPRRLITTEIFLRKPIYRGIWLTVGIDVVGSQSIATVREAVRRALLAFLAPLPQPDGAASETAIDARSSTGWPLSTPVIGLQLWAVASRVDGVALVNGVELAADGTSLAPVGRVELSGLELPRLLGIAVTVGSPLGLEELRRQTLGAPNLERLPGPGRRRLPVPVVPEGCH